MEEERIRKINGDYVKLAKRYGLNPTLLKEIVVLNSRGYSQIQIASMMGISRQTVAKYLNVLKTMDQDDFWGVIIRIGLILGGIYLISELLEEKRDGRE